MVLTRKLLFLKVREEASDLQGLRGRSTVLEIDCFQLSLSQVSFLLSGALSIEG
jgi:hypothetical protein